MQSNVNIVIVQDQNRFKVNFVTLSCLIEGAEGTAKLFYFLEW